MMATNLAKYYELLWSLDIIFSTVKYQFLNKKNSREMNWLSNGKGQTTFGTRSQEVWEKEGLRNQGSTVTNFTVCNIGILHVHCGKQY